MPIVEFLSQPDWDRPFFKRLPSNDTGAAPGHQGGMVIPKELRQFFPGLVGRITPATPTIDRRLWADLYDGERFVARVNSRYQFQSWGGARSPESRLTDNLSPLRSLARPNDILVIQRSFTDLELYRLTLVRQASAHFPAVDLLTGRQRWGVLGKEFPMTDEDFDEALKRQLAFEEKPFALFEPDAKYISSKATSLARTIVFRDRVTELYQRTCCVCKTGLRMPSGPIETEAVHIVPRRVFGSDDARNGLSLCRRHQWAFERGLFGIDERRLVFISPKALVVPENGPLREFSGKSISEASDPALRAAADALSWHMSQIVLK